MDDEPHRQIERLEDQIEALTARIESCRKFILASRVAIGGGAVVIVLILIGAIRFDPAVMVGAMAAVIGGIVLFGSNNSTAKEAQAELTAAEASRGALIESMDLQVVAERPTLH
jgi:hypothetical protein